MADLHDVRVAEIIWEDVGRRENSLNEALAAVEAAERHVAVCRFKLETSSTKWRDHCAALGLTPAAIAAALRDLVARLLPLWAGCEHTAGARSAALMEKESAIPPVILAPCLSRLLHNEYHEYGRPARPRPTAVTGVHVTVTAKRRMEPELDRMALALLDNGRVWIAPLQSLLAAIPGAVWRVCASDWSRFGPHSLRTEGQTICIYLDIPLDRIDVKAQQMCREAVKVRDSYIPLQFGKASWDVPFGIKLHLRLA
jgi:hypothetical protein